MAKNFRVQKIISVITMMERELEIMKGCKATFEGSTPYLDGSIEVLKKMIVTLRWEFDLNDNESSDEKL